MFDGDRLLLILLVDLGEILDLYEQFSLIDGFGMSLDINLFDRFTQPPFSLRYTSADTLRTWL